MECKICGRITIMYGHGTYYFEDGKTLPVPFYYCRNCNSFIRQVDEKSVLSHLKAASHTNIKNEERFFNMRIEFFKYLFMLTKKHSESIINWLDFGCSYGHLLEYLKGRDIECCGIEISEEVRVFARKKGLKIFENLDELPEEKKFDVISFIDSFYYSNEPVKLIKYSYSRIRENGLMVLRITNRNWLAKIKKKILRRDLGLALGDATISYSKKSISFLLERNGFKILKITNIEKGKSMNFKIAVFYIMTAVLNTISFGLINLSPGLIVIAKKNPLATSQQV
jgi:2-polyprenyl-3-methyl-5-hydroxy-6-metoxy-1,4-benzoquinol methylase